MLLIWFSVSGVTSLVGAKLSELTSWKHIILSAYVQCATLFSFPAQVAVYTRQTLNIRITANFLLALAASQPATKPHLRRYFCAAVQLPSDWLEVVRIYSTVRASLIWSDQLCLGLSTFDYVCPFPVLQPLSASVPEEGHGRQVQGVQRVSAGQIQHAQTPL